MFLQSLELTTALRPELLPDETLLFVQNSVGLYEGKFKIASHQNGHAYLTSYRICYVDDAEPRKHSVAIELKNVDRFEFYAGFLKSSAKITLYPKPPKRSSIIIRSQSTAQTSYSPLQSPSRSTTASPLPRGSTLNSPSQSPVNAPRPQSITWICPICSYSNQLPAHFDASTANAFTPLQPCLACGIKPPLAHILKAVISSASSKQLSPLSTQLPTELLLAQFQQPSESAPGGNAQSQTGRDTRSTAQTSFQCPRCTFLNHPSLLSCELCSAPLVSSTQGTSLSADFTQRPESPGPSLDGEATAFQNEPESIKLSFRGGGEKIFHERLKGAMVQRKWLLQNARPVPRLNGASNSTTDGNLIVSDDRSATSGGGIIELERRGHELRKNNQTVIGNAFEDLEALMASAKEIVALAESFAAKSADTSPEANALITESAAALGMVTTKDMLGSKSGSDTLYLSELSRNLAEYLTDDRKGVLRREGGIMSLVDLWAMFNRTRNGVELISPMDFEKAARQWGNLGLPVRLREFRNGLLVVQGHDRTDDKTIAELLAWLKTMHSTAPMEKVTWDWQQFGRGVTVQEAATHFGWSIGIATEELEMAEEKGALCREESVEGLRFWENWILNLLEEERNTNDPLMDDLSTMKI